MKARDIDTLMSCVGSFLTVTLIVLKGLDILALSTSDCLTAGITVASCTKLIAVAQILKTVKGSSQVDVKSIPSTVYINGGGM